MASVSNLSGLIIPKLTPIDPSEGARFPGATWIHWRPGALDVDFLIDSGRHAWLQDIRIEGGDGILHAWDAEKDHSLPLAQIRLLGEGSYYGTSQRQLYSTTSSRLVYVDHKEWTEQESSHFLEVSLQDPETAITVRCRYCVFSGVSVLRCTTYVENRGDREIFLQTVSSLSLGFLNRDSDRWWDDYEVVLGNNTNFREGQWKAFSFADLGMDYCGEGDFDRLGTRAAVVRSNLGTWSTATSLSMGALCKKNGSRTLLWQIEHSGSWRWELGNILHSLYLVAGGPIDQDHQWTKSLKPGETFASVSASVAVVDGPIEASFVPMTKYRRRIRRPHADNEKLPVIFNDYMNCLNGDPTEEKVLALVEPAVRCGAEYFCIDAGWYADEKAWWPGVGAWQPSTVRFPNGFHSVLDKIRAAGMIPGVWLEPEVIGVRSPVVSELPDEAYFQRKGVRIIEQERYHLDFRCKEVVRRLDAIVDGLITEYGVGYFKFDYNLDVTLGTDVNAASPGDGMFEHRRAYMAWVNGIFDRFPHVVIETCSSGAQRLDYEMLSTHSIQSTSDQQDPVLYSGISASIITALTPEQSASWAYPQPTYSDDLIALCMVNSLMGRAYISGRIDLLNDAQLGLVAESLSVYKAIRPHIRNSLPFWPLGLPQWSDPWLVFGLSDGANQYLGIWRRGGVDRVKIPLPSLQGETLKFENIYPQRWQNGVEWDTKERILTVTIANAPSACVVHIQT